MEKFLSNRFLLSFIFFVGFFLLFVIIFNSFFPEKVDFDYRYIYLAYIILFYVNLYLLYYIYKTYDKNQFSISLKYFWIKLVAFIVISLWLYFYFYTWFDSHLFVYKVITIELFLFSIIFTLDSRFMFLIALNLLFLTPFYIILKKNHIAENYSIYAYYYLVIGVVVSIFETFLFKNDKDFIN